MEFRSDNVRSRDLPAILALNQTEVPRVGPLGIGSLRWFAAHAACFRVMRAGDEVAAFLIGLRPGLDYKSPNYRWFCAHYDDFGYVDRVAVGRRYRRAGLASRLYDDFLSALPAEVPVLTCEVNLDPPNPGSMRFHERLGFRQVATQETDGGAKTVALLALTLADRRAPQ
ncbi:MAG: GNAT family N-acetyltransferase [Woeseiaceae bacterium]|nr:GNAT family N-acetyltransferase [Woeseiaceae bacterium]